jgi:hypothetical protein
VKRAEHHLVGPDVPDQTRLRPPAPVRHLDEFLEFLARIEALFGPIERPPQRTTGERFLL